jgi:hypothetical protein
VGWVIVNLVVIRANSVANSAFALDKRYNAQRSSYPYLKHAPFVSAGWRRRRRRRWLW